MAPHTPVPSGSQRPPPPNRQLSALTQKSILSTATSFEADDERSFSDFSGMDEEHGPQPNGVADQPRYPGEDTRVTSRKEVSGWYSYGWAAEVFVVCGMGSFIPVTLEQLARGQGVLLSDRSTPCHTHFDPPVPPILNSTSFSVVLLARDATQDPEAGQCIINFLGREISTASFAMYTFSLSVLLQALLIISISGAADHGKYRKTFLLTFAFAGAIATMGFLPVTSKFYLVAALLAIIANICYGASSVLLNSFLPLIVRHHPSVQASKWFAYRRYSQDQIDEQEGRSLLAAETIQGSVTAANHPDAMGPGTLSIASPELQLSTKISSYGNGIGYMAAVVVQTASIAIIVATGSSTFSLRLVLFVVGLWWFLFSIPAAFWLRPRPGPPLPGSEDGSQRSWAGYIAYAWRSLGKTAMRARLLKDVLLFLGAWFLLSDGIATVSGTAVLFAKTELGMKPAAIALINVIVTLSGILGAFTWSILSRMLGLKPSHTILACICIFELIPIYGLIGYLPPLRRLGVVGLQQPWEIYPLGAVFGFVLGGISSYCRSVFGELIPPGSEATFYALYSITDKGSSVFGPAIVGAIVDATGDMRASFWFLAVLIIVPAPLMWLVDVERGKREGLELAKVLEGQKNATNSQNYQTISGAVSSTTRNDPGDGIER